jgi:hypothetical protein
MDSEQMTTAYILTEGEYSGYHIIGVYSTKELAEKAQFVYAGSVIEEYELDNVSNYPPGMKAWYVNINANRPQKPYCHQISPDCAMGIPSESMHRGKKYCVNCWAVDEEHAIKIALDKFYQYKAQSAGIA